MSQTQIALFERNKFKSFKDIEKYAQQNTYRFSINEANDNLEAVDGLECNINGQNTFFETYFLNREQTLAEYPELEKYMSNADCSFAFIWSADFAAGAAISIISYSLIEILGATVIYLNDFEIQTSEGLKAGTEEFFKYIDNQNGQAIELLKAFLTRDKFSEKCWLERGLNPSDEVICNRLNAIFDKTVNSLTSSINNKASVAQLEKVLKNELIAINHLDFDTEEREFIGDLFFELSKITNIEFGPTLNSWMYGQEFSSMKNTDKFKEPTFHINQTTALNEASGPRPPIATNTHKKNPKKPWWKSLFN